MAHSEQVAADGAGVMQPVEHVDWFARALLLFNRSLLRQLPESYNIRLDPATFLSSFTFTANNTIRHPTPWAFAPDPMVGIPAGSSGGTSADQSQSASQVLWIHI